MSEKDIKPVAWIEPGGDAPPHVQWVDGATSVYDREGAKLYDQSAIDRLLEKIDRLEMIEGSWLEFMEKTEWVQKSSEPGELGFHRADVLKRRIDRLTEERDAAVAEINFLRNENFQQRCEIRELIERIE